MVKYTQKHITFPLHPDYITAAISYGYRQQVKQRQPFEKKN